MEGYMKPKVFVNSINKIFKNNKDSYHFDGNVIDNDIEIIDDSVNINVRSKLNDIFDSDSFVYKSRVEIIMNDNSKLVEDVIAIKDNKLITLNNTMINIDDIKDIKKAM